MMIESLVMCILSGAVASGHSGRNGPSVAPTTHYHHTNADLFDRLSMGALIFMIVILLVSFVGGCMFTKNRGRGGFSALMDYLQGIDDEFSDIDSSLGGSSTFKSVDLSSNTSLHGWKQVSDPLAKLSPLSLIDNTKQCLEIYEKLFGNLDVPIYWKVPRKLPWPEQAWGLRLGEVVKSICGHAAGSANLYDTTASQHGSHAGGMDTSSSALMQHSPKSDSDSCAPAYHEHRSETWYELFYDLVFVAAAIQLGKVIKYDHRPLGLIKASLLFLMLRSTWDHLTLYQNRFHVNDSTHMAYYLMQSLGAFIVALHLRIEDDIHHENQFSWDREVHQHPISLMATLCRLLTVCMYVRAFYFARASDRRYLLHITFHTSLSAIVFACAMHTPTDDSQRRYLWVWALGIFVEKPLMYLIAIFFPAATPPLVLEKNVEHLTERQGTFFMLILGEAVIQLVQAQGDYDMYSYVRAILGFAIVFNVGNVYYEQQQREASRHVLVRSQIYGLVWIELQSLLSLCVLFFAVGIKLIFHSFEEQQELRDEYIMCGFASISLILMYSMSLMHRGFDYNFHGTGRRLAYHTFFYTVSIAVATIPLFATSTTLSIVMLHVSTTVLVFQDIFNRTIRMHELHSKGILTQENASKAWVSAMDSSVTSDIFRFVDTSGGSGTGRSNSESRNSSSHIALSNLRKPQSQKYDRQVDVGISSPPHE